jgi:acyl-CoA synthetase (NDP forming)
MEAPGSEADFRSIERFLLRAQKHRREALTEPETMQLLSLAGVPVAAGILATTAGQAERAAKRLGFPVVLKVVSPDLIHKSDAGGVQVGLKSMDDVRRAYRTIAASVRRHAPQAQIVGLLVQPHLRGREVILGATRDPQLGPVMVFGVGGTAVELLGDVAFRLAPIDDRDARSMLDEIRAAPLLRAFRGSAPVKRGSIVTALLRLSRLMCRFSHLIHEIEINPMLVTADGAVAVDAMAVIARR